MYKADLERVTYLSKPCGSPLCPTCVVGWLQDRAAPAWVYWNGTATTLRADDNGNTARDLGVKMMGPNTVPGVLSVPLSDGYRGVFVPAGIVDGHAVRGRKLDEMLVRVLRAIRLDDPTTRNHRDPPPHSVTIPSYMTDTHVTALAASAGVPISTVGVTYRRAMKVPPEAFDMLRELVRGRA